MFGPAFTRGLRCVDQASAARISSSAKADILTILQLGQFVVDDLICDYKVPECDLFVNASCDPYQYYPRRSKVTEHVHRSNRGVKLAYTGSDANSEDVAIGRPARLIVASVVGTDSVARMESLYNGVELLFLKP
jgi:hypothetical protein